MDSEGQAPGKHNIHNSKALSDPAGSQVPPLASPQIQQQQPQPSKYWTSSLRVRLQPGQRHLRPILDAAGGLRDLESAPKRLGEEVGGQRGETSSLGLERGSSSQARGGRRSLDLQPGTSFGDLP